MSINIFIDNLSFRRILKKVFLNILILIIINIISCDSDESESLWYIVDSPVDNALYTIYALDRDEIFAAGYIESFVRYDGKEWYKLETPDLKYEYRGALFYDMFFINEKDGWSVGWGILESIGVRGIIAHWDGERWEDVTPEPYEEVYPLMCVFFPTPDEGWAGSEGGRLYHYIDGEWSLYHKTLAMNIYKLWFNAPDDGWAVGSPKTIYHWDGREWRKRYSNEMAGTIYKDICFTAPDDGWLLEQYLVYLESGSIFCTIYRYDSENEDWWDTEEYYLEGGGHQAISFSAPDDGWAVGAHKSFHWDGSSWSEVSMPYIEGVGMNDVYAISSDDVWAVGDWGTIMHFTGWD